MPTRRYFVNAAPQQTLSAQITSGATSCAVSGSFSGWPTQFPFFAALDKGTASAEIVSVTAIVGTTATITRGQGGTAAVGHPAGATIDFVVVAQDFDEANAHTSANSGVHGVSGNVVGTSDAQTLTNKTISGGTLTGTVAASGATLTSPIINSPTVNTPTVNKSTHIGDASNPGAVVRAGASGTRIASFQNSSSAEVAYFDQNGNLVAPTATSALVAKSFTNEAAATAAGANVTGATVWLTTPTTAGTSAGPFYWNGSAWTPYKRPRIGARATTTATQALTASSVTILNNGGTSAWTATEDSGGFVSGTGGTTTPITIPAGLGGLYQVGVRYQQAANSASRLFSGVVINGSTASNYWIPAYGEAVANGSLPIPLNAGDTVGMLAFTATATNASIGCQVFCYRIGE